MTTRQVKFQLDDPNTTISVASFEQMATWLQAEREHWQWLINAAGAYPNMRAGISNAFGALDNSLRSIRDNNGNLADIQATLTQFYAENSWLRASKGSTGQALDALRSRFGDSSAAFAFAFQKGSAALQTARFDDILAAIAFGFPELDRPAELARRFRRERSELRSEVDAALGKVGAEEVLRGEAFAELQSRGRSLLARNVRREMTRHRAFRKRASGEVEDALVSIRGVEQTYKTYMGIQAPVEYWNGKAERHRTAEKDALSRLLWFFPISLIVLITAFFGAAYILLQQDKVAQTVYVLIAAGLGSAATLIFWVGRLLTRLYLSQHHLRHDAEERAVMTTTYLALTHEKAASDDDKKIILAALFRSVGDGLVKDDGPPELTFAGLLSRLGTGK